MSYNGSGTFQINTSGQPVVAGTVISSTAFNALTADLATGLSTAITKDGQTTTTARIPFAAGINSSLTTDSSSTSTGSIITAGGVGVAKALYVGTTANIAGVLSTTSPNITTSITTPSTSFDLINATATTLNLGGAATAVNVGAATGTMTVANTTLAAKAITASTTLGVTGAATLSSTLNYGGVTLTNAVTGTGKMVLDTSPTLVTPALGTPSSGVLTNCTGVQYNGFKNRIINGAMVIDQRNAGASVTPTSGQYTLDRFLAQLSQNSKYTVQQNAGSVTPPTGFSNYLGVTSSSAYSVVSSDFFFIAQNIEGFNTADLAFGTASAKTVTLSFWVYSSLTGTFGGALRNSASSRSYPFSYTISSANTWEQKTITIAGDTSGTWIGATNGIGINVAFSLGMGSTYSTTANAWATGNYASVTGATSVVGTNGATFYITGVQLEKGSTATSFDYRPYGTELALCQRYYYNSYPANSSGSGHTFAGGVIPSALSIAECCVGFPVTMRAAPTVTFPNGLGQSGVAIAAAATASQIDTTGFLRGNKTTGNFTAASSLVTGGFTASAEL